MRTLSIVVLLSLLAVAAIASKSPAELHVWDSRPSAPVLDAEFVRKLNSDSTSTWTASLNPRFANVTVEEARSLLGTFLNKKPAQRTPVSEALAASLPTTFDARTQWPNCVFSIQNQQQCGDCWSFGTSEAASDRMCIAGGQKVLLSAQDLTSCDKSCYGCSGGFIDKAFDFIVSPGIHSAACEPFTSGSGNTGSCPTKCSDGSSFTTLYSGKSGTVSQLTGVTSIQQSLQQYGPVAAGFDVYQDFFSYSGGVYVHKSGSLDGGHAIKIIGWGTLSNTPYWLCANSWGSSWGIQGGYFMILRGSDECGIEDSVYGVQMNTSPSHSSSSSSHSSSSHSSSSHSSPSHSSPSHSTPSHHSSPSHSSPSHSSPSHSSAGHHGSGAFNPWEAQF